MTEVKVGDFGDRNVEVESTSAEASTQRLNYVRELQEAFAKKAVESVGSKVEDHAVLVLVDLQGIYLRLHEWLVGQNFPIFGGLVLSRLATFQILDAFERVKSAALGAVEGGAFDLETVVSDMREQGPSGTIRIKENSTYLRFLPKFELFYARAPLADIEWRLRKAARSGSWAAQNQLDDLASGIVQNHNFKRDYSAYDDFIIKLKANPEYAKSQEGFFNFYVGDGGLKVFDEKEVDTRIVIRAMETLYDYEAQSLCIVSSDQDFMPLHEKAKSFGVPSFQADFANFVADARVARRLQDMGDSFLRGSIDPNWPLKIIIEAVTSVEHGVKALYTLDERELQALCKMHNSMNDFHVAVEVQSDGNAKMTLSKPA